MGEPARSADRRLLLAVAAGAVLIQLPWFDRWFQLLDEGYLLALADAINHGRVLYRDVNVDAPFPGAFYLMAGWFRLFGTSVYVARIAAMLLFTGFATLVVALAGAVLSRRGAALLGVLLLSYRVWAFPHWHVYSYSGCAMTFLAGAVCALARYERRGSLGAVWLAGALAAAGTLCKQDYGVAVVGALGLVVLADGVVAGLRPPGVRAGQALWRFVAGVIVVIAPAALALGWAGALPGLVEQAVRLPLGAALGGTYVDLPPVRPLFRQDPVLRGFIGHYFPAIEVTLHWQAVSAGWLFHDTAVWDVVLKGIYHLPGVVWPLAAVVLGVPLVRRVRRGEADGGDRVTLVVLAWGLAFRIAFSPPRDWVHLMMVYPPTLLLCAMLAGRVRRCLPRLPRRAVDAVGLAALAALTAVSVERVFAMRALHTWRLPDPRGGVYVIPAHGALLDDVLRYVAREVPPDAPLPVYPTHPAIGFLAARAPVAGFYIVWPVQDPTRDERIIAALDREQVDTIIYGFSQFEHLGRFQKNAPRLFAYLVDHYAIDAVFTREAWGPLLAALRRHPPPPGRSLLDRLPADGPAHRVEWPFTPVLAAPVGTADAPQATRLELAVPPEGALLRLGFGVNPDRWDDFGVGAVAFTLRGGPPGHDSLLLQATLDPAHQLADRRWVPATIDLRPWAGSSIVLVFETRTAQLPPAPESVAGWSDPRLVPPPAADE